MCARSHRDGKIYSLMAFGWWLEQGCGFWLAPLIQVYAYYNNHLMSWVSLTTFLMDIQGKKRKKKKNLLLYMVWHLLIYSYHTPPFHHQYTADPSMRPSIVGCNLRLHSHYSSRDSCILCEMGLQTERHLSSTQTACYQQKQTKNCVTPLMWATDAKPLVSP